MKTMIQNVAVIILLLSMCSALVAIMYFAITQGIA